MRISDWSSDVCSSDLSNKAAVVFVQRIGNDLQFVLEFLRFGVGGSVVGGTLGQLPPCQRHRRGGQARIQMYEGAAVGRSEEHTSELQSLMRISYAVFCLKNNKNKTLTSTYTNTLVVVSRS